MKTHTTGLNKPHPSGKRRTILGQYKDVRIVYENRPPPETMSPDDQLPLMTLEERKQFVDNIVARVRRHFGKENRKMGDRYSRVARALLTGRHWSELDIPRRSFTYARKKVEKFFEALKMRLKSTSKRARR